MKTLLLILFFVFVSSKISAQMGINATGAAPASSAMLDVSSTNKGMLIPRMTTVQREAIASPQKGLLVFDNTTSSFWFHNGTTWGELISNGASNWVPFNSNTELSSNNFSRFYLGNGTNTAALSSGAGNDGTLRIHSPTPLNLQNYLTLDGTGIQARQDSRFSGKIEMPLKLNPFGGNVGIGTATPNATLDVNGHTMSGTFLSTSARNTHAQGAYLEWNKDGGGGKTYLLNQKGLGAGGFIFGEVNSANGITERLKIDNNGGLYAPQSGNFNIVPLGVAEYTISESYNATSVSVTVSNIAGSMILSASAGTYITVFDVLDCTFPLNTAITSNYTKIIAMNTLSWASEPGITTTYPLLANFWSSTTNTEFKVGIVVDGFTTSSTGKLSGTVIFYGIK
jgi:hypothetical protein